jgi:NAD(P)-dependent dehydrogenase (short-subunit alcohol dehydrogenase family)
MLLSLGPIAVRVLNSPDFFSQISSPEGIGYETARVLLLHNANVIVAARNKERGEAAVASLAESTGKGENVQFIQLDLADLSSIRAFTQR